MAVDPSRTLLVSLTEEDAALARRLMPGAVLEHAALGPTTSRRHPGAQVVSVMVHDTVSPAHLEGFKDLKVVVTRSCGHDHLPTEWLKGRGVSAYALGGYATQSVMHLALALILALLYRLPEAVARTRGGATGEPSFSREGLVGRSLSEVTVGVVGTGRIGGALARAVAGLEGRVLGYDIDPDPVLNRTPRFAYVDSLEALLAASDVVSLHVPLTDLTRRMIDAHALGHMKDGALLVNTARGDVVDQTAVAHALKDRRLGGYAADTLPGEPRPRDLGLFQDVETALVTPHVAAYNRATIDARFQTTAQIVKAVLAGDLESVRQFQVV